LDKFEETMQMMSKMTEKERMKAVEDNKGLCICPDCPTYNECAQKKGEVFYCGLGRSPACVTKEEGCICPACPITEKRNRKRTKRNEIENKRRNVTSFFLCLKE
jgi:hypothetical protein